MAKLIWNKATTVAEIPLNGGSTELHVRVVPDNEAAQSVVLSKYIRTERYTGYAKGGTDIMKPEQTEELVKALRAAAQQVQAGG